MSVSVSAIAIELIQSDMRERVAPHYPTFGN